MRVVWITPFLPTATGGGGSAHEFELLKHAARHHEIHLICDELPPGATEFSLDDQVISAQSASWTVRPQGTRSRRLAAAQKIVLGWPTADLWVFGDRVRALSEALADHLRHAPADLVHLTYSDIAAVAETADIPVALLLFDVASRQLRREREVTITRRGRAGWWIEQLKVARWERRCFSSIGGVACVSPVDGEALRPALGRSPVVLPNPIPDSFFDVPDRPRSRSSVVIVANLAYRPNVDAVTWFASEIWKPVVRRVPDATLRVVGSNPDPEVVAAVASIGAELHRNVPDVRPFYWDAAVTAAPIRLGSGTRNKVLHAFACGAPVVATSVALEGIAARDRRDLLVADDSAAFSEALVRLLEDPAEGQRLAQSARALLPPFRTDAVMDGFLNWWESVTLGPSAPREPSSPELLNR